MKKIRGILVDTRKGISIERLEYTSYVDIRELLECAWITCVSRNINDVVVDVYCDEEALLKQAREPAIITRDRRTKKIIEILFGNCFICTHNKKGEITGLPKRLVEDILLTQASMTTQRRTYQVLQAEM